MSLRIKEFSKLPFVSNNYYVLPTAPDSDTKIHCPVCNLDYDRATNRHSIYANSYGAVNICARDTTFFKRMVEKKCRLPSGLVNFYLFLTISNNARIINYSWFVYFQRIKCTKNKDCPILQDTRNPDYCSYCRFQRCKTAGMKPELVGLGVNFKTPSE